MDHNAESIRHTKHPRSSCTNTRHIIIIWFEPTFSIRNNFRQSFDKLNMGCYKVDVSTDMDKCMKKLAQIDSTSKSYLLTSGMWARHLLYQLQRESLGKSINTIFVYSSSPQRYEFLRESYSYTLKLYTSIEEVANAIQHGIDQYCEVLHFYDQQSFRNLFTEDTIAAFIWFILFKDALFYLPYNEKAKNDMLNVCRRFYTGNTHEQMNNTAQLNLIAQFENTYLSEEAPKWYSRSSFLYKLINRALRTQDVEQLYIFRYFIRDLSSWISQEFGKVTSCKEKFFLYRGSALAQEDFESLSREKLLAPNGFFSTSRDIGVATLFIGSHRPNTTRVLYKIECDMTVYSPEEIATLVPFADISGQSLIPDEQEVLFDLGATFEIEDIEANSSENDYAVIHLIPSCEGAHISDDYLKNCREEMKSSSAILTFGALLLKIGKHTAAQHYFEQLLNNPDVENISDIYYYLGWAHAGQLDYGQAITNFERAHDLIPNDDGVARARIFNGIGKALLESGCVEEALPYYIRALDLRTTCLGSEHNDVADSCANVARIYNLAGNNQLALEYYTRSIKSNGTRAETVGRMDNEKPAEEFGSTRGWGSSTDSSEEFKYVSGRESISSSLYEMGAIQYKLGDSTSGLHNMKRALSLDRRSISSGPAEFHRSSDSLGNVVPLVNYDTKEIEYRVRCLQKARLRYSQSEPEIADALEKTGSAYAAARKFNEALSYYLQALTQREKQEQNLKNSLDIARTQNFIGDMYRELHQYRQALWRYRPAAAIYDRFPARTNQDRLRTNDKIKQIIQEISLKSDKLTTFATLKSRSTTTSPRSDRMQRTNHQRSGSIGSNVYFS